MNTHDPINAPGSVGGNPVQSRARKEAVWRNNGRTAGRPRPHGRGADHSEASLNRRQALGRAAAVVGAAVVGSHAPAQNANPAPAKPRAGKTLVCLFSKPLHNRPFADLPALLRELGFDAIDLTCRPNGHVLPERAADDLPRAAERFRDAGVSVPMITTAITDAGKDHAETIIKTAAGLGIRYAKLGYYRYGDLSQLHATLADVKARLRDVTAMCRNYGVLAGFHNHAGDTVGAALWDVWHLIHDLPADAIGSYFDIRHATVEGGEHGWRIGLSLLAPRIIMVAVKDFLWHKHAERGWRTENVPLGEGMVRGEEAFTRLKEVSFAGPISLHMEYMAGNQHTPAVGSAEDRANLASIRKDRETLMGLLRAAGLAPQGA